MDGTAIRVGDHVLVKNKRQGVVARVSQPGEPGASDYASNEGEFLVELGNGELQVWPRADEDIEKIL